MAVKTSKINCFLVLLVVSLSFIVGWTTNAGGQKSTVTWEYKTVQEGNSGKPVDLNALGAEGWELVAVTSGGNAGEQSAYTAYFFKRRK